MDLNLKNTTEGNMKARVKKTGEIVDGKAMVSFNGDDFYLDELEVIQDDTDKLYDELDVAYWENMKHQYAGMAMQGMLTNEKLMLDLHRAFGKDESMDITIPEFAIDIANTLVKKLKEEKR